MYPKEAMMNSDLTLLNKKSTIRVDLILGAVVNNKND
jgi:hypothetical protein